MSSKFIEMVIDGYAQNEELEVTGFQYKSGMNSPFVIKVDCLWHGRDRVVPEDIIGHSVSIMLTDSSKCRYFNGILFNVSQSNMFNNSGMPASKNIKLVIGPDMLFMGEIEHNRIFSRGNVVDYINNITSLYNMDVKTPGRPDFVDREFCIQYRETDLGFVNRLAESEGIFYYFEHESSVSRLVMGSNVTDYSDKAAVAFGADEDQVYYTSFRKEDSFLAGYDAANDYDYNAPRKSLLADRIRSSSSVSSNNNKIVNYRYPYHVRSYISDEDNAVDAGEKYSSVYLEGKQSNSEKVHLTANGVWWDLDTGSLFSVQGENCEYVATGYILNVKPGAGGVVDNEKNVSIQITAIDSSIVYRPLMKTPVPDIPVQSATVVGMNNGSVSNRTDNGCDTMILVKVKFHWDLDHTPESNECSCWMRAGQAWAGNKRGFIFTPRVGDEVLVAFECGHPDMPIIIGCAHNGKNKLPYSLASDKNVSGMVSRTVPDGERSSAILFNDTNGAVEMSLLTKGNQVTVVEKDSLRQVNGSVTEHIKSKINQTVDKDVQKKIGGKLLVEASEIVFKVGENFIQMNSDGITMLGNQVLENSGGEAPPVQPVELPEQKPIV